jgi:hypothetical protein
MTIKEKAEELVNSYRIILMNEDTECGNEILCTSIAKQCALIAVEQILTRMIGSRAYSFNEKLFWNEVKKEIELL